MWFPLIRKQRLWINGSSKHLNRKIGRDHEKAVHKSLNQKNHINKYTHTHIPTHKTYKCKYRPCRFRQGMAKHSAGLNLRQQTLFYTAVFVLSRKLGNNISAINKGLYKLINYDTYKWISVQLCHRMVCSSGQQTGWQAQSRPLAVFVNRLLLAHGHGHWSRHWLSMAAFPLQEQSQSRVAATKTKKPRGLKYLLCVPLFLYKVSSDPIGRRGKLSITYNWVIKAGYKKSHE